MNKEFVLNEDALRELEGTPLFYPCSGNDLVVPLRLFSPTVREFWFVDVAYFRNDVGYLWEGKGADQVSPVLAVDDDYELIEKAIDGPPTANMEERIIPNTCQRYKYLKPCVLTEIYRHRPTGKPIKVHRRRGFGEAAFNKVISSLGVFFYRRDSEGEGGSGYHWLWPQNLISVLRKLVSGGLIVTDGVSERPN
jgi:hypothetical protein